MITLGVAVQLPARIPPGYCHDVFPMLEGVTGPVRIDASLVEFVHPRDLMTLRAYTSYYAVDLGVEFHCPISSVTTYMSRMNFFLDLPPTVTVVNPPRGHARHRSKTVVELTRLVDPDDVERAASKVYDVAKEHLPREYAYTATVALSELAQNAVTHGSSSAGAFLVGQRYRNGFELSVADLGMGVRNHLRQNTTNPAYATDRDAIVAASMAGISGVRFDDPRESRGYGLCDTLAKLGDCAQSVCTIRSGQGIVSWMGRPMVYGLGHRSVVAVPGTWIDVVIGNPLSRSI